MTEAEWLACTDPTPMLEVLWGKVSDRKLRLFAVACCRRVWALMKDERSRIAVRAAERFADGMITREEMLEARDAAIPAFAQLHGGDDEAPAAAITPSSIPPPKKSYLEKLLDALDDPWWEDEFDKGDPHGPAIVTARHAAWAAAHAQGQRPLSGSPGEMAERREQAGILREIFGNPFRPATPDPGSLTANAVSLARTIYDGSAFDRLPILADVLEQAGCTNHDILNHCRQPGEHVRGCWVVDMILGKE